MNDDALLQLLTVALATDDSTSPRGFRVVAKGEIDLATAARLGQSIDTVIDDGATLVILDVTDVAFLDSSGLRVIVNCGNRLSATGGRLLIDGMSGAVQRVLEVSGLIDRYRS